MIRDVCALSRLWFILSVATGVHSSNLLLQCFLKVLSVNQGKLFLFRAPIIPK
jgi:hypothetical protein